MMLLGIVCVTVIFEVVVSVAFGSVVKLLVALPFQGDSEQTASWERGFDILPGAQIAAESIENLSENKIQFLVLNSGQCGESSKFDFLELFFTHLSSNEPFIAVGFFCNGAELQLIVQSPPEGIKAKLPAAVSFPNLIKPPTSLIKALFKFMKSVNWQNLEIITETRDSYFSRTSEALYSDGLRDPNTSEKN